MLDRKTLHALGCWAGYKLDSVVCQRGDGRTLSLYLKAACKVMHCEECGAKSSQVRETAVVRRAGGFPLFDHRGVLHVPRCDG